MNNFENPTRGKSPESAEPDWDTIKDAVREIFFENQVPKSLDELKNKLQEQARSKNISPEDFEKKFMAYLGDEMANSVD